jgi:hypothetical protein
MRKETVAVNLGFSKDGLVPEGHIRAGKGTTLLGLVQTRTFEGLSANCAPQLHATLPGCLPGWQVLIPKSLRRY